MVYLSSYDQFDGVMIDLVTRKGEISLSAGDTEMENTISGYRYTIHLA